VRRPRAALPAVALVSVTLVAAVAGCGADPTPSAESGPSTPSTTLTVFAAASLKPTFTTLGKLFESRHADTSVTFSFAGSSDLVAQLQQGAPADVLATADSTNMDKATADGLVDGTPVTFAANTLEIAVPPDNPGAVASWRDLMRPGLKLVLCAPEVPCGSAAQKIETATGVDLKPVSEEQSVTDVLNKVTTGEADAGLVYVTDVQSAGDKVRGIPFPESSTAVNSYPIAALASGRNQGMARDFVALVTGADGQRVLSDAGFDKP